MAQAFPGMYMMAETPHDKDSEDLRLPPEGGDMEMEPLAERAREMLSQEWADPEERCGGDVGLWN